MPRVCILTTGSLDSNPRIVKEAATLHNAGYDVVTIVNKLRGLLDLSDKTDIPWHVHSIALDTKWYWRTLRIAQISANRLERFTGIRRLADFAVSAQSHPLLEAAKRTPADLYVAHYPPALPAAAAAARLNNARYSYDAEDFHLGDWPDDAQFETERRLVYSIESHYLPGCAYVTAASPMIADALVATYGIKRPKVVLNAFPREQAPSSPTTRGSIEPGPSLYWFSQTIGPHRGLECAIRAIGIALTKPHLYLRGTPAPGFVEYLSELAISEGANGRVHIIPPAAPDQMERLAGEYDLGLASETGVSQNREICLTNKLFSFLLAGLPPMMSDTRAQRQLAVDAGLSDLLYPIDDAYALAQLIDDILLHPSRHAALRERVWGLGQERFSWEQQGSFLLSVVRDHAFPESK